MLGSTQISNNKDNTLLYCPPHLVKKNTPLEEMTFSLNVPVVGITSHTDMRSTTPSPRNGEILSDLDSSQELLQNPFPPQNGKRCGVIFVDTSTSSTPRDYNPNWRSSNQELRTSVSSRDVTTEPQTITDGHHPRRLLIPSRSQSTETVHSFIVVKGKYSGIWSLPKGRMSCETETEEECALREVYEETGIKLETIQGLPRIVLGRNVYFIMHTTKEEFKNFVIHDNYEVSEVCWKSVSELRRVQANKDLRAILQYPRQKKAFHRAIYNKEFFTDPQRKSPNSNSVFFKSNSHPNLKINSEEPRSHGLDPSVAAY